MAVTYETSLDRVLTTNEVSGFTDVVKMVVFRTTFFDSDYADKNSDGTYKWCTEAGVEVYITFIQIITSIYYYVKHFI